MTMFLRNVTFVFLFSISFAGAGSAQNQTADQGRELYLSYGCAVCHGPSGDGKGLRKVDSELSPTNFTDRKSYRFAYDKISIQHSIKFGIKEQGTVMPAFQHISDQELEKISLYLISLQKQN